MDVDEIISALENDNNEHMTNLSYSKELQKKNNVLDAVRVIIAQHDRVHRTMRPVEDYEAGPVSKQILRVVLSYVDYVNRTVWSKT